MIADIGDTMKVKILLFFIIITTFPVFSKNVLPRDSLYVSRAQKLEKEGDKKEAVKLYKKAIIENPYNIVANHALAFFYFNRHEYEAALCYFQMLYKLVSETAAAYYLGYVLYQLGRYNEALVYIEEAVKRGLTNDVVYKSLRDIYFTLGKLDKSYEYNDAFVDIVSKDPKKSLDNLWRGEDVAGKIILLRSDIGIGDAFQWMRYARFFKQRGATVIAAVRPTLLPIVSLCSWIDKVVDRNKILPYFDFQVPTSLLPFVIKPTFEDIKGLSCVSYLRADKALVKKWEKILVKDQRYKIGICWDPCHYYSSGVFLKNKRAIPLYDFYALSKVEGVSLYSLQQYNGMEQIPLMSSDFTMHTFDKDFDKKYGGFMDTAAVMKNLDLVITVDTSIAHLAGALGIEVWVMVPYVSSFRWFLDWGHSPWYPTMRLFRQSKVGDWQSVIDRICEELLSLTG